MHSKITYYDKEYEINYPQGVDEAIIRSIEKGKIWERHMVKKYPQFIKSGDTVLDIGGYLGTTVLPFSNLVGNEGRVIVYEPQPTIFNHLSDTLTLNEIRNVELKQSAIYSENKEIYFIENNTGKAGIRGYRKMSQKSKLIKVHAETIDSLSLKKLDFIKIDVEGAEWEVLKGGVFTIKKLKPTIHLETFSKKKKNIEQIKKFCIDFNYEIVYNKNSDFILSYIKPTSKKKETIEKIKKFIDFNYQIVYNKILSYLD